jgi:hypothetical protein
MPKTLFILNDPPYGHGAQLQRASPRRFAIQAQREEVKVFLIGDAAACAKKDQKVPQGYYNTELMLRSVAAAARSASAPRAWTHEGSPTRSSPTRTGARSRSSPIGCSGPIARSCSNEGPEACG